ncbi:zinc finger BED domain-containing protein RICESLEEPER 2-like [Silene latifolia]|uniref:zinc finger BED domain-containing protein RICESLEEPER 2-like n=1 Tax=Silene latifolia TaxID=37657 RepID=UPI003D78606C
MACMILRMQLLKSVLCKYVKASPARKEKFQACIVEEKIECKSLVCLDVETRWNSTYLMLDIAIKFKKAFGCLLVKDSNLQKEMKKVGDYLTIDEWKQVSYFLPFLKIFYDATLKLSGSRYVTSNYYVEIIFGVGEVISQHLSHKDEGVRNMASKMKLKYDKYWGKIENLNLLLFVSLILDPRYKMTYVEWMVKTIYGNDKGRLLAMNITYFFETFFDFYASSIPKTSNSASSSSTTTNIFPQTNNQDDTFNFGALLGNKFEMEMGGAENESKSEWEKYLTDDRESRHSTLNILQWWKDNQKRYPILAKMARDVLAIPVSTVASESAFTRRSGS